MRPRFCCCAYALPSASRNRSRWPVKTMKPSMPSGSRANVYALRSNALPRSGRSLKAAAESFEANDRRIGRAHDCVVLAQRAANVGAALAAAHARRDRDRYVERARQEWRRAFGQDSPFALLAQATGYTWSDE